MKSILLAITLMTFGSLHAQQIPSKKVEYFTKNWKKVDTIAEAAYWTETVYQDSIQATARTFYVSGKPKSFVEYENARRRIMNGVSETWYENGQLQVREHWLHGDRQGELLTYYADGILKRREQFSDGKSAGGECFDAQGKLVPFFDYEIMPTYPGGSEALRQFIALNIQYPTKALRQAIKGQVQIGFSVDSTGQMQNIRIVKSVHPLVDAEALRVMHYTARWTPAQQDGRPVEVSFIVPINFNIGETKLFKSKK
ncbi:energy transducer TonB [Hymenobacter radiodurans]|uniref:energy transducer TonB n=1 Tax=Hymenobacter radiodurans TaxID=2496028 RepID=UPI0014045124|nr:energy transducer TonB [Hymenobacter radiodurans]